MTMLEVARMYVSRGWSVIPVHTAPSGRCSCGRADCDKPGKHPTIKWTDYQRRLPTDDELVRWFSPRPVGLGIITGGISGILVLDVDGKDGRASLAGKHLPVSPVSLTGGGGEHRIFKHPGGIVRNFAGRLVGVDLRGDGGLIVAPPSIHSSGQPYRWAPGLSPDDVEPAGVPDWLRELVRPSEGKGLSRTVEDWRRLVTEGVPSGQRNAAVASLAGHLLRQFVDPWVALEILLTWNRVKCRPPLSDDEVAATVDSVARLEARRRRGVK